jgi:hypothetical protein
MKRWILVACLVLVSALGFVAPTGATASTLAATKLSSGKPVKVTISTPGQQVKYTFAATANKNVTFNVTNFDFSQPGGPDQVTLYFYEPQSSSEYTVCNIDGNTYCNFTAPVAGTWSLTVAPYESNVGSMTLTFASDVAAKALTSGTPVTTTIKYEAQEAHYTFAATAKKNVTFNVTHFDFSQPGGPDQITLYFYEPGSSTEYTICNIDSNTYCNFTAPVTGTWSITLIPYEGDTGSLTLTFANDVPTEALTAGTAVTTTIKYAGQEAGYTFAATAKKTAKFMITRFGFSQPGGPDQVTLYFYEPDSSSKYTVCNIDSNTTCSLQTPVGGTWFITLIPYEANVGSLTIKLA